MYFAKKKKKKGFTLIELLVVIAIIGILATIVIVNVNSARNKAKDAVIKADVEGLRNAAEMWYTTGNTYVGCDGAGTDWASLATAITAAGGSLQKCTITASAWCGYSGLPSGGNWCADYTGYSGSMVAGQCTGADCTCL